ncbi:MAG: acyltransferase [Candidatus Sumerlaeota bacterium]|nr:acyltransferase [Candidatus Sumerlaeota bacterium]
MGEVYRELPGVFIHPHALVETQDIGENTRIWAFAHVLRGCVIGSECNIGDHAFLEGGVRLGNRVTVKNGVALWEGVTCEDDVFLGPNVALTNDLYPRSRATEWECTPTLLRKGCSIGANATILAGVTIGRYALVGLGAVVTRDVPDYGLAYGSPARLRGFVGRKGRPLKIDGEIGVCPVSGERYRIEGTLCKPIDGGGGLR